MYDGPLEPLELVGPLVDDLDAHRGQHRQDLRQRQRRADPEHLEPRLTASGVELLVEGQVDPLVPSIPSSRPRSTAAERGVKSSL